MLTASGPGVCETAVVLPGESEFPTSSADGRSVASNKASAAVAVLADLPDQSPDVQDRVFVDWEDSVAHEIANGFADRHPDLAAKHGFPWWQKAAGLGVAALIILAIILAPTGLMSVLVGITTLMVLVQLVLVLAGLWYSSRWSRRRRMRPGLANDQLPSYTVLVPAYQEQAVIGDLVGCLAELDYPTDRLEVLLLVERRDTATQQAIKDANPPAHMRIVQLPPGIPQTKPRSCNAGLLLARGELVVVYDAEDRPQPDQLRRAAEMFAAEPDDLACVQATLLQANGPTNVFTACNGLEYALHHRLTLPGLVALGAAFPLGGTSNHFPTATLRELGGWDAWNVTEDADLGMRCRALGYRTDVVDSITYGEAPETFRNWLGQHTRWHKGHLMTTLVHTRRPLKTLRRFGPLSVLALIAIVCGKPLQCLIQPIVFALGPWILIRYRGFPDDLIVHPLAYVGLQVILTFISLTVAFLASPTPRRRFLGAMFASGFLHWVAGWRALHQLITAPFLWEKTTHHGAHRRMLRKQLTR